MGNKNAFRLLSEIPDFVAHLDFLSIHLSGSSSTSQYFRDKVISLLREYHIKPVKICFEITETVAISNLIQPRVLLLPLKKMLVVLPWMILVVDYHLLDI